MKIRRISVKILIFTLLISSCVSANKIKQNDKSAPDVFLDCSFCDFDYIRERVNFVNYVRERKEAEIYIMVTAQRTGGGGRQYVLNFIGQNQFQGKKDTLFFNTGKNATEDITRYRMQKYLKLGLLPYLTNSDILKNLNIQYKGKEQEEIIKTDRWNNWVFSIELSGYLDVEETSQNYDTDVEFQAERITKEWKFESELDYRYNEEIYDTEDETVKAVRDNYGMESLVVKSLGRNFSMGLFTRMGADKYSNLKFNFQGAPAIEYNFFPYSQANLRQLCLRYYIGYRYNNYINTTLYNKNQEALLKQSFVIDLEYKRRWGEIDTYLEASNYFPDINKNRLTLHSNINLHLIKGFSFVIHGGASLIHDQISLSKEGATKEERLLRIKEVQTDYSYYVSLGFEYTFGSIYNNIVNPRF